MASETFHERLSTVYDRWLEKGAGFAGCNSLAIITGKIDQDEDIGYLKSYALFTWLLGSELQGTLLFLTKKSAKILCTEEDEQSISKLVRKRADSATHKLDVVVTPYKAGAIKEALTGVDGPVGVLTKEKHHGDNIDELSEALKAAEVNQENISEGLSLVMNVKDERELSLIKTAADLTCNVFKHFLLPEVEDILDRDKKISHTRLSERVENCILEPRRVKMGSLEARLCDPCYPPIIQSGGKYDLRPSAQSDDKPLTAGCLICSLGARYRNYCSNAIRTYLIDASAEQEQIYEALVEGQEAAIGALKQGQKLNTVFKTVAAKLNSKKEGLSSHLPKNIGFAIGAFSAAVLSSTPEILWIAGGSMSNLSVYLSIQQGIEYRDAAFVLNAKNERLLEPGMVFNVAVGLQNLKDSKKGDYALMVADTVVVPKEGESPVVYTQSCKKAFKSISYKLQDEEQEDEEEDEDDLLIREAELQTGSRRSRHAKSASEIAGTTEEIEKRKKHQEELARRMLEEGKARLGDAKSTDPSKKAGKEKTLDEYIAYESPEAYPASLKPRQIYVDMQNESILLPINGVPVPFHISAVKNVGKIEEGDNSYIRINFHFPASGNINNRNKADAPKFPDPEKDFIKEMTFRSANSDNINESVRRIRELRRRFVSQLQEESKPEVQVQQENLILDRSATRKPYLNDVAIRPSVQSGKGNKGILEAHTNGFRFRTAKGVHIDVIYANVKHAFFQEAKSEVIVLLHFNLIHPIMIRNKKTNDVQFYVEVMESAVKLNETRRKAYDQDELVEEQRERERRNRMNNIFLKFTKDVEEKYNLEFDAPYRNLGFHGAPKNANVFLMPTVSCIVSLVDWPPFILSLQNVELAYLERVSFSLKNFDLVFVFKDFVEETAKGVSWSRISSIPTQELDPLRKFLDEQEIKYYEGSTNLVWDNVLSNIRENYADFVESGGWNFLEDKEDEEGVEQEDELEEGDEEFELEEESAEDEESEEESDDYEESDDSGDAFEDELGGDSAEGEAELSSDEEGMSWDELEKKAAREDADRGGSDDDRRRSREKRGKYSAGSKRRR